MSTDTFAVVHCEPYDYVEIVTDSAVTRATELLGDYAPRVVEQHLDHESAVALAEKRNRLARQRYRNVK